jgi:hypothetical protein
MAMIAVVATALMVPSMVSAQFGLREIPPKADFFRFKASYTVKATGEVIQFDLVRPCQAVYARDMNDDSIGLGPGKFDPNSYFYNAHSFPKVTADHHAIMVSIPMACAGQTTTNGQVAEDLLPFMAWFEDADDFAFGWMYASEGAYKSRFAKVTFNGATIEKADRNDFLAWQARAGDNFRPSNVVESPFGFTYPERLTKHIPDTCIGVRRLALPLEVREMARAVWPADHPKFWTLHDFFNNTNEPAHSEDHPAFKLGRYVWGAKSDVYSINGIWNRDLVWTRTISIPTRAHGSPLHPMLRPPDFYPLVRNLSVLPGESDEDFIKRPPSIDIAYEDQYRGFLGCFLGRSRPSLQPFLRSLHFKDPQDPSKPRVPWLIGGQPVSGQDPGFQPHPTHFLETDEFSFEEATYVL